MQKDDGKHRVISYARRHLNIAEKNYDITNHENLVIWVLRHFREHILVYRINVLTNHYAVTEN